MVIATIALVTQAIAPAARAEDPKVKCANAYEQAQRTRKKGELRASQAQLLVCTEAACPAVLREECLRWADEVERALPTVVFAVRDPAGQDVTDVRVLVDGVLLAEKVDGKAHAIDPGSHTLRFESEGSVAVEQVVVIREGEKLRTLSVTLPSAAPVDDGPKKIDPGPARPIPASVYVLSAIGIVGLGGFAYFGLKGKSEKSALDDCKPGCDPASVDHAKRTFVYGDVALGVSVVSLGIAAALFFTRPSMGTSATSAERLRLVPELVPTHGGLTATWIGRF